VIDGVTGLLVPPKDAAQLAAALARLADDPALRAATGRAARERAVAQFSIGHVWDETWRMYRELT
jgi:starch synthase